MSFIEPTDQRVDTLLLELHQTECELHARSPESASRRLRFMIPPESHDHALTRLLRSIPSRGFLVATLVGSAYADEQNKSLLLASELRKREAPLPCCGLRGSVEVVADAADHARGHDFTLKVNPKFQDRRTFRQRVFQIPDVGFNLSNHRWRRLIRAPYAAEIA